MNEISVYVKVNCHYFSYKLLLFLSLFLFLKHLLSYASLSSQHLPDSNVSLSYL